MNIELELALAISCAIYRSKGNQYITSADSNKNILKNVLTYSIEEFSQVCNEKYIIPTCEDYTCSKNIIKHFRKLSFGIIGENLNDFMKKVYSVSQSEKIKASDFGIIAILPKIYYDDLAKSSFQLQIKNTSKKYVGSIGSNINVVCTLIKIKFIEQINSYSHTAITSENDLISWLSKKQAGFDNDTIAITGKVKSHNFHWQTSIPETHLNYVKYRENS